MSAPPSRELLARLPKAELHCHLDGSVRPATLIELAAEEGARMPRATAEELGHYMLVRDARSLEEYLARFEVTLSVMQTEAALERIAYELAIDAAAEGVRYLEIRYCPTLNQRRGLDLGATIEAPLRGLARAEHETGIVARTIVTALRNNAPAESIRMAQLAAEYRGRGVVGFDLAGGEMGFPASAHERAFLLAREHDMACTCHAGEGDGAQSVREAVHRCGAHRIGHATRLAEDPDLVEYVADRQIALEICLTSNVQTRVATTYEVHPFRRYFDEGLNVVLNTDNRLMSGVTLTDEYAAAATHLAFTMDELCDVALNGFRSAFLPWPERQVLLARVTPEIDALRAFVA
ncbi:MAG: adenosine deaminase [Gemmatimonadetes bacterium]|nr:adenosine deaminase [Gemmatimonadota bacterium]